MIDYSLITGIGNDIDNYLIKIDKNNLSAIKNIKKIFQEASKDYKSGAITKKSDEILSKYMYFSRRGGTVYNVIQFLKDNFPSYEIVDSQVLFVRATTSKALTGRVFRYANKMAWYDPIKEKDVIGPKLKKDLERRVPRSSGVLIIDGYSMEHAFIKEVIESKLKKINKNNNIFVAFLLPNTDYCASHNQEILHLIKTYSIDYVFGTSEEYSVLFGLQKKKCLDIKTLNRKLKPKDQRFPIDTTTSINLLQTLCYLAFAKNTKSIITCQEYGAFCFHNRFSSKLEWKVYEPAVLSPETKFIHTYGAGDCFSAAFIYYLLFLRNEEIFNENDPYDERDVEEQWHLKNALKHASVQVAEYLKTNKK